MKAVQYDTTTHPGNADDDHGPSIAQLGKTIVAPGVFGGKAPKLPFTVLAGRMRKSTQNASWINKALPSEPFHRLGYL